MGAPDPSADPSGIVSALLGAAAAHRWLVVLGLAVMLLVWFVRSVLVRWVPFFRTDPGGVVLAVGTSLASVVAGGLVEGRPLTAGALASGALVAVVAMGGWSAVKKALLPLLNWILPRLGLGPVSL